MLKRQRRVNIPKWRKREMNGHHSMLVARSGDTVYIRICGPGNMKICPTLQDFARRMIVEGYKKFIVDLIKCSTMDSTFMGSLVELSSLASPTYESLLIINAQEHCEGLLEGLGLDNVLCIKRGETPVPGIELEPLPEHAVSKNERMLLIRRAHEGLVKIDKKNEATFGPFLSMLAKEMKGLSE